MHHCVQLIASCSLLTYSPLIILFICCCSAYMLLHSIQQGSLFVMMTKDMPFFIEMPSDSSPISYFRRSFLALSTIVQTDSQVVRYNIDFCSFSDLHEKIFSYEQKIISRRTRFFSHSKLQAVSTFYRIEKDLHFSVCTVYFSEQYFPQ